MTRHSAKCSTLRSGRKVPKEAVNLENTGLGRIQRGGIENTLHIKIDGEQVRSAYRCKWRQRAVESSVRENYYTLHPVLWLGPISIYKY